MTSLTIIRHHSLSLDIIIHEGLSPGLNYNKANDTFSNSLRENYIEGQVEFTLKVMERARVTEAPNDCFL